MRIRKQLLIDYDIYKEKEGLIHKAFDEFVKDSVQDLLKNQKAVLKDEFYKEGANSFAIASISLAYKNKVLLDQLDKRGNYIAKGDFTGV